MKKILATMLVAAAVTAAALADTSADVLVWYVDTEDATEGGQNSKFDTVKFWAVDSENNMYGLGGLTYESPADLIASHYGDLAPTPASSPNVQVSSGLGSASPTYYTDLSGLDLGNNTYSYLMELWNGGYRVDWMVSAVSLDVLQDALTSVGGLQDAFSATPTVEPYNFGAQMVPEPTSGLLLLVGGALLALRRRRA